MKRSIALKPHEKHLLKLGECEVCEGDSKDWEHEKVLLRLKCPHCQGTGRESGQIIRPLDMPEGYEFRCFSRDKTENDTIVFHADNFRSRKMFDHRIMRKNPYPLGTVLQVECEQCGGYGKVRFPTERFKICDNCQGTGILNELEVVGVEVKQMTPKTDEHLLTWCAIVTVRGKYVE